MRKRQVIIPIIASASPLLISIFLFAANKIAFLIYRAQTLDAKISPAQYFGQLTPFLRFISTWILPMIIMSIFWLCASLVCSAFYWLFVMVKEQKKEKVSHKPKGV
jgi:hypothetical protein